MNFKLDRPGQFGWLDRPEIVESGLKTMPVPMFGSSTGGLDLVRASDEKRETLMYEIFRKVVGEDAPKGPQGIGDCTAWGWSGSVNKLQATNIVDKIAEINENLASELIVVPQNGWSSELVEALEHIRASQFEYQEIMTEATYALGRVEIGQQHGSMEDGGTGIWCAQASTRFGYLSRKAFETKHGAGSGTYSPERAKKWGASGLPDEFEPEARLHVCKVASMVTSFKEAAACIQNLQPVPVCSNRGFTMTRDNQGFCLPQGTWYHCMYFDSVRWDRPGLLCNQSWGKNTPTGPVYKDQPDNAFWVDASVVDYMLSQRDSYTINNFGMYVKRNYVDWSH